MFIQSLCRPGNWLKGKPAFFIGILALLLSQSNAPCQSVVQKTTDPEKTETSRELAFLEGLWQRGYYDLANEFLAGLTQQKKLEPVEIQWLIARSQYEEASVQLDLNQRRNILEQSVQKMTASINLIKDPAKADDARLVQIRAMIELAHLIWIDAQDQPTDGQKDFVTKQARDRYAQARNANNQLLNSLNSREKAFKLPVLPDDPRRPAFERTQLDRLNAELQDALINYEEAQTWPEKSQQRTEKLTQAAETLQKLHEANRQQVAGQNARLWQAKCLQELGKLPEASGIYGEIIDQADPALRDLRRRATYFRILAYRDRGDFALAADECRRWMQSFPDQIRTEDGLGVQLELARNLLLQLPNATPKEKAAAERVAAEQLSAVVRVYSRYQAEAKKLLSQIRKNLPVINPDRLDFNSALAAGQESMELKDWKRAKLCFDSAASKALKVKDMTNYVKARYFQAVSLFRADQYYDAYVLGQHIASQYPSVPLAANAAEIALAAMTYAYNAFKNTDPVSDLNRLMNHARFIARTWPDSPQADTARVTIGEVARGQGHYDEAISALGDVPKTSEQFAEAQAKLGLVLWRKAQSSEGSFDRNLANRSITSLQTSIDERLSKGVPPNDPKVLTNQIDLADILTITGKPEEGVQLLNLIENSIADTTEEIKTRFHRLKVRALISADQLDQALTNLAQAEKAGLETDVLSVLYFQLGQSLQDEMKSLQEAKDGRYVKLRQSYQSFLKALAASRAGESWQALQWVAEAQLEDGQPNEALRTLQKVSSVYLSQESFTSLPENAQRVLRTQIRLAEAARKTRQFSIANSTLKEIEKKSPNLLSLLMEKGRLLEAEGKLNEAFSYWRTLTSRLGRAKPRPDQYYEAWLESAHVLEKLGKKSTAKQTLTSVLRLSGSVMPPDWKNQFESEIQKLSESSNQKTGTNR